MIAPALLIVLLTGPAPTPLEDTWAAPCREMLIATTPPAAAARDALLDQLDAVRLQGPARLDVEDALGWRCLVQTWGHAAAAGDLPVSRQRGLVEAYRAAPRLRPADHFRLVDSTLAVLTAAPTLRRAADVPRLPQAAGEALMAGCLHERGEGAGEAAECLRTAYRLVVALERDQGLNALVPHFIAPLKMALDGVGPTEVATLKTPELRAHVARVRERLAGASPVSALLRERARHRGEEPRCTEGQGAECACPGSDQACERRRREALCPRYAEAREAAELAVAEARTEEDAADSATVLLTVAAAYLTAVPSALPKVEACQDRPAVAHAAWNVALEVRRRDGERLDPVTRASLDQWLHSLGDTLIDMLLTMEKWSEAREVALAMLDLEVLDRGSGALRYGLERLEADGLEIARRALEAARGAGIDCGQSDLRDEAAVSRVRLVQWLCQLDARLQGSWRRPPPWLSTCIDSIGPNACTGAGLPEGQ